MATSSKLRAAKAGDSEELKVDMSPMIDMVFLLLIFFLVNATMIIVKQDPEVKPPIASNSKKAQDGTGRIVINVYEDGTLVSEGGEILDDDEDVIDLVRKEKERIEAVPYEPKLHLRVHKDTDFKNCRKAIRLAAKAGVDKVLFATYQFSTGKD